MGLLSDRRIVAEIPVEIRRNKRRRTRIGMSFDPGGVVVLDAPLDATDSELEAVIVEHGRWLKHKLARIRDEAACVPSPRPESGEVLQYLGNAYELLVQQGRRGVTLAEHTPQQTLFADVKAMKGRITVSLPSPEPDAVGRQLKRWYTSEAKTALGDSLFRWQQLPWLNGALPQWRTSFMRSQWGSCSATGIIALNTHLIKVPQRLIDYVVVHELCHLRHHNHGRRFYGLMERHMPDWDHRREELDRYLPVLLHE